MAKSNEDATRETTAPFGKDKQFQVELTRGEDIAGVWIPVQTEDDSRTVIVTTARENHASGTNALF